MPPRAARRFLLPLLLASVILAGAVRTTSPQAGCAATPSPGADLTVAIAAARPEETLCLSPGTYLPFTAGPVTAPGVTLRASVPGAATIEAGGGEAAVALGAERFTLDGIVLRGGQPAISANGARNLTLRNLRVESAGIALHLEGETTARLEDLTIDAADAGLIVRRGATVDAERVRVLRSGGVGVAVLAGAGHFTLSESEIADAAGPALFAGVPGCGELAAATLEVPACFEAEPEAYLASLSLSLDRVTVRNGPGSGLVFYPGVQATVQEVSVLRRGLTGLFAWGAAVEVAGSTFAENGAHAIEYRAFPHPRAARFYPASGSIHDSVIRGTQPLGIPSAGTGILARGAELTIRGNEVTVNFGGGVLLRDGTSGDVAENTITGNGGAGLCIDLDLAVSTAGNVLSANRTDEIGPCEPPDDE